MTDAAPTSADPSPEYGRVTIERMGGRGEGVAALDGRRLYVPYALPDETVTIDDVGGERATLVGVTLPSPDRVPAVCPYFGTCGGCAVQAWATAPYAAWKRGLVVAALARAGLAFEVAPLVDAHGAGRRRAAFHAGTAADGRTRTGFNEARSHAVVAIEACPILDPGLAGALPAARAIVAALLDSGALRKPLDILATATSDGLDIDLRGHGPLANEERARLTSVAATQDLVRLSNHGTIVLERRKPAVSFGAARLELPPGGFLQATAAGEAELAARVLEATAGARRVADLFCGVGTFALRLAAHVEVAAFDSEPAALAALERGARATPGLRAVAVATRDLHRRPLNADELKPFEAVVLDPPRAGAEAQMRAIAASHITRVASVSCDAESFARDTAILSAAGFAAEWIVPVDQFRYSAHVEIVAAFRRKPAKRVRRLLG